MSIKHGIHGSAPRTNDPEDYDPLSARIHALIEEGFEDCREVNWDAGEVSVDAERFFRRMTIVANALASFSATWWCALHDPSKQHSVQDTLRILPPVFRNITEAYLARFGFDGATVSSAPMLGGTEAEKNLEACQRVRALISGAMGNDKSPVAQSPEALEIGRTGLALVEMIEEAAAETVALERAVPRGSA